MPEAASKGLFGSTVLAQYRLEREFQRERQYKRQQQGFAFFEARPCPRLEARGDWLELLPGLPEFERLAAEDAALTVSQFADLPANEVHRPADVLRDYTLSDLRRDTRMLCLAREHLHPMMWSHYAAGHNGVCLHFRAAHGTIFGDARGVIFEKERKPILVPLPLQGRDEVADRFNLEKTDFWCYESEYRVITHPKKEPTLRFDASNRFAFPPDQLCGITLGMKVSSPVRGLIVRLARERANRVPVWSARENRNRFWLEVEPIQD